MRRRDRDEEFRSFYFAHARRLERFALLMTADRHRAEDLAQEALVRAYVAWPRIRDDDPGPYVRRTIVNLCRKQHRRSLVEARHAPDQPSSEPAGTERVDESLRIASALAVLSPVRRAVVVLRFYDDMPEAEISRVLDRPLNTVKSDIRRSLERLRSAMQEGAVS